jgi:hypothetical protein
MIHRRKDAARRKVVDLIEEADRKNQEISYNEIKEILLAPPFFMKKTAISDLMNELCKNNTIIRIKRGRNVYYTKTAFIGRPKFIALFISTFQIVGLVLFTTIYTKNVSLGKNINNFFITTIFIIVMVVTNILWFYLWKKHENNLKYLFR